MHHVASPDSTTPASTYLDLSLVIACYGDEPHLFDHVKILAHYLSRTRLSWEMIFVEDASPLDDRREIRRAVSWLDEQGMSSQVILHPTNQGRGRSVQDGFERSKSQVVATIDIDLEHHWDSLASMVYGILDGDYDGAIGQRVVASGGSTFMRVLSSFVYRKLVHGVLPLAIADTESGLKVFHRSKLERVLPLLHDHRWFWDTEIVYRAAEAGMRLVDYEIVFRKKPDKQTTVKLFRDSWAYLVSLNRFRQQITAERSRQRISHQDLALAKSSLFPPFPPK